MTERVLLPTIVTEVSPLSNADFEALEKAGGVSLSPQQRDRISHQVILYKQHLELYQSSPRVSEVTPCLKEIETCAIGMIDLLKRLPDTDMGRVGALHLIRDEGALLGFGGALLSKVEMALQQLHSAAISALERLPADFGRGTDDPYLDNFIRFLHGEFLAISSCSNSSVCRIILSS